METEFCSFVPLNVIGSVLLVFTISATITVLFLMTEYFLCNPYKYCLIELLVAFQLHSYFRPTVVQTFLNLLTIADFAWDQSVNNKFHLYLVMYCI